MKTFELHTVGAVHESYWVEAETAEQAREKFREGEVTVAHRSEVDDVEIVAVKEST